MWWMGVRFWHPERNMLIKANRKLVWKFFSFHKAEIENIFIIKDKKKLHVTQQLQQNNLSI